MTFPAGLLAHVSAIRLILHPNSCQAVSVKFYHVVRLSWQAWLLDCELHWPICRAFILQHSFSQEQPMWSSVDPDVCLQHRSSIIRR